MEPVKLLKRSTFAAFVIVLMACETEKERTSLDLASTNVIPWPVSVTATNSSLPLTEATTIFIQGNNEELIRAGQYLADKLSPATGFGIKVQSTEQAPSSGNIYLTLEGADASLGDEGYDLTVTEEAVTLKANTPQGIFYGIQTIRQLLPPKVEMTTPQPGPWEIATGSIHDYPSYSYRGSMLDVARHFFEVEDVKRYIDLMATYKMNMLHLHLSDDQGWRIEIRSWPDLATHGGSTEVGGGEGGYYTQEEYTEIVQYAQERYITIVPEIDMPGHTNAALASYAELNCDGEVTDLYTGTEVGFSTLCTDKEIVYQFVDEVVGELAALTPGPWIHIGGDESHVTPLEDYIPFINRAQDIVKSHGKQVIGWDEIAHADLLENTIVQHWANVENAKNGVNQGAKVLMSPASKAYLDMQYDSTTELGLHWAGYVEVDTAYMWDPETLVPGVSKEDIIGIEGPLWTETITNMDQIEYMIFPRMPGLAEIGWSPADARDWNEYKVRLGNQGPRFEAMEINYYRSPKVPWPDLGSESNVN